MTFKNTTVNKHKTRLKLIALVFAVASLLPFTTPFALPANAASLSNSVIRLNRMSISQTNDHVLVIFKVPASNAVTEDEVDVTFPGTSFFTIATPTIATTDTVSCTADAAASGYGSVSALPGTLTGAFTGQTVKTTGVTNLALSTAYCFYITAGVSTAGTALPTTGTTNQATIATKTTGSTDDSSVVTLATVASNADQIAVSATVNPYFTFTLSTNADTIGTGGILTQASVNNSNTPSVVSVATNAKNGWIGWISSLNGGLRSTSLSKTIASTGTYNGTTTNLGAGPTYAEDYGLDASTKTSSALSGAGVLTTYAEYNGDATHIGTLNTAYNMFASSTGPTDGDTVTLKLRSTISGITPAASDYQDTLTVVGAGNF